MRATTRARIGDTRTYTRTRVHHRNLHLRNENRYMYNDLGEAHIPEDIHARTHDANGRIVGPRNRTHVYMEAMQPRARSCLSVTDIDVSIRRTRLKLFKGGMHARASAHTHTLTHMRAYVLHVPTVFRIRH